MSMMLAGDPVAEYPYRKNILLHGAMNAFYRLLAYILPAK